MIVEFECIKFIWVNGDLVGISKQYKNFCIAKIRPESGL